MKKVNISEVEQTQFESPEGVYAMRDINLSHALGREGDSTDLEKRHLLTWRSTPFPPAKRCARTIRQCAVGVLPLDPR